MAVNNITDRTAADALIPEQVSAEIIKDVVTQSAALQLFKHVPMSSKTQRQPVLSSFPLAYWVNGDTGLKQTTQLSWANKYLIAEEIAVIVPVPDAVMDDASFDIWGEAKPLLVEAIGRTLDQAVFFGVQKPTSWPAAVAPMALAAGNVYTRGTSTVPKGGIAEDFNQLWGLVEDDGFDITGNVAPRSFRKYLRGARDANGQALLDVTTNSLGGEALVYSMPGLWPTVNSLEPSDSGSTSDVGPVQLITGDFTRGIIGMRQDITFKLLDQAVISDSNGAVILNLAQQDSVALRVVIRVAYQVANPLTHSNPNEATRSPFGVMVDAAV